MLTTCTTAFLLLCNHTFIKRKPIALKTGNICEQLSIIDFDILKNEQYLARFNEALRNYANTICPTFHTYTINKDEHASLQTRKTYMKSFIYIYSSNIHKFKQHSTKFHEANI